MSAQLSQAEARASQLSQKLKAREEKLDAARERQVGRVSHF